MIYIDAYYVLVVTVPDRYQLVSTKKKKKKILRRKLMYLKCINRQDLWNLRHTSAFSAVLGQYLVEFENFFSNKMVTLK